jgi:hypothetical protein
VIISLRGTSGSGKTHLVREVTSRYAKHRRVFDEKDPRRKRPVYELHGRNPVGRVLVTPGHYMIGNGGMDTLRTLDEAYAIARWADSSHFDVLMEGKNMSDGVQRAEKLQTEGRDVRVVHIDEPIEECIQSVRERGHKIAEDTIRRTDAKVRRNMEKFTCQKFQGRREECLALVIEWLGLT